MYVCCCLCRLAVEGVLGVTESCLSWTGDWRLDTSSTTAQAPTPSLTDSGLLLFTIGDNFNDNDDNDNYDNR